MKNDVYSHTSFFCGLEGIKVCPFVDLRLDLGRGSFIPRKGDLEI